MFIIWGSGGDSVRISPPQPGECPDCHQVGTHSYWLVYRYFHFFFLLGFVTKREYRVGCDRCNSNVAIDPRHIPVEFLRNQPIPFFRRWGLLAGGAVAAVGMLMLLISVIVFVAFSPGDRARAQAANQRRDAELKDMKQFIDALEEPAKKAAQPKPVAARPAPAVAPVAPPPAQADPARQPPVPGQAARIERANQAQAMADAARAARPAVSAPAVTTPAELERALADLKSNDESRVKSAAESLAVSDPFEPRDEVVAQLLVVAVEGARTTQLPAAKALSYWCTKENTPQLLNALDRLNHARDGQIRRMLFGTLAKQRDERAIPWLIGELEDSSRRSEAEKALVAFGAKAEPALIAECNSTNRDRVRGVLGALEEMGSPECIPTLEKLTQAKDALIRSAAKRALDKVRARG
jgi:hypothetical protein